ncbi:MarR family transcriptional regulator [Aurantivibrio plasticivorans]
MSNAVSDGVANLESVAEQVEGYPPSNAPEEFYLGMLGDLVSYQLRRAQMRMGQEMASLLDELKITPPQFSLLSKIKYNQGVSQTALAKANGIERSTLGEIIDRFEKRQLVERRKHATDRRAYALYLTEQGEELMRKGFPMVAKAESEMFSQWEESDRQQLIALLKRIGDM